MLDKNGRSWATVEDTKPGDLLEADGGFDCLEEGEQMEVLSNSDGEYFVQCGEGYHFLYGQLSADGTHYIGFYKVST